MNYFHEDSGDPAVALDLYMSETTPEEKARAAAQARTALHDFPDNLDLYRHIEDLGANIYLGEDPAAYRTWLLEIARRLDA